MQVAPASQSGTTQDDRSCRAETVSSEDRSGVERAASLRVGSPPLIGGISKSLWSTGLSERLFIRWPRKASSLTWTPRPRPQ